MTLHETDTLKDEIVRALKQTGEHSHSLQLGRATVLLSSGLTFGVVNQSDSEPKPYPETKYPVSSEYDSWLS